MVRQDGAKVTVSDGAVSKFVLPVALALAQMMILAVTGRQVESEAEDENL